MLCLLAQHLLDLLLVVKGCCMEAPLVDSPGIGSLVVSEEPYWEDVSIGWKERYQNFAEL